MRNLNNFVQFNCTRLKGNIFAAIDQSFIEMKMIHSTAS